MLFAWFHLKSCIYVIVQLLGSFKVATLDIDIRYWQNASAGQLQQVTKQALLKYWKCAWQRASCYFAMFYTTPKYWNFSLEDPQLVQYLCYKDLEEVVDIFAISCLRRTDEINWYLASCSLSVVIMSKTSCLGQLQEIYSCTVGSTQWIHCVCLQI